MFDDCCIMNLTVRDIQENNSKGEKKMTNLKIIKSLFDTEGTWKTTKNEILQNGVKVGTAYTIVNTEDDRKTYLEDIGIDEEYRNQGIGAWAINELAKEAGFLYFAPTNENNQRLYERIAEEYDTNTPEVDQGYGVYFIER